VELAATSTQARHTLEAALPQLQATLADAGMRVERLDVSLREAPAGAETGRGWSGRSGWGGGASARQQDGRQDAPSRRGWGEEGQENEGAFGQWLSQQAAPRPA
jgi:flagellar hook-length control protein FliK